MSKLDEMIRNLCPDGVEYKKLGEIATISRGGNFQKKDFLTEGVPCIHYGQIYTKYGLFTDKTFTFISEECAKKQKMAQPNDIVMAVTSENIEDVCKCLAWLGDEPVAVSGHSAIIHHNQNAKYLVYYFHSQMFFSQKRKLAHGTKVIEVTPDTLVNITLPVPPFEVQHEIVRILDDYTENVTELQRQLAAEMTARKTQYSFYRSRLLTFDANVEWKTVDEIAEVTDYVANGSFAALKENVNYKHTPDYAILVRTTDLVNGFDEENLVYIDKHAYNYLSKSKLYGGEIIINNIGAGVGTTFLCPCLDTYMSLAPNSIMVKTNNNKFYYYWLNSKEGQNAIRKIVSQGSLPKFNKTGFRSIRLPVPPLDVQNRIVNVLDNFEKICSDLNIGLPAEIEARQKQYEYYRDKLLTFKEVAAT